MIFTAWGIQQSVVHAAAKLPTYSTQTFIAKQSLGVWRGACTRISGTMCQERQHPSLIGGNLEGIEGINPLCSNRPRNPYPSPGSETCPALSLTNYYLMDY